jgi:hypothetical protein
MNNKITGFALINSSEGRKYNARIVRLADVDSLNNISQDTGTITVTTSNHEYYYLPDVARWAALTILAGDTGHITTRNGNWDNTIIQGVTRKDLNNRRYIDCLIYPQNMLTSALKSKITPRMIEIIDNLIGWSYTTKTIVAKCDYKTAQKAWKDVKKMIEDAEVGDDGREHTKPKELLGMADMLILLKAILYITKKRGE